MTGLALAFVAGVRGRAAARRSAPSGPIFRERGKINAEVTGRLTESLGGVRVVKGYHAEAREEAVFAGGVQRLLDNVLKIADRDLADEPLRRRCSWASWARW